MYLRQSISLLSAKSAWSSSASHLRSISSSADSPVDFFDGKALLSSSTTFELLRAWMVFKLCSIPSFVQYAPSLLNLGNKAARPVTNFFLKHTFFRHFVGAEDLESVKMVMERLRRRGVNSILDYAAEDDVPIQSAASSGLQARLYPYQNEKLCDQHLNSFSHSIDAASQAQDAASSGAMTAFAAMKVSALVDPTILEKISDGRTTLSEEEAGMARRMEERINAIVERAKSKNVRLLVDAEQSYLQPAIDSLCLDLMSRHNRTQARIFTTFQAYRTDALHRLQVAIATANKQGFKLGVKLVRGAYLVMERERAKKLGIDSPVWPSLEETHSCFESCLETLMFHQSYESKLGPRVSQSEILIGSHNQESVEKALNLMSRLGLETNRVHFAQLYGMGDRITFALGANGYSASKYVPFGSMHEVVPYLIRRAQENSSFFSSAGPTSDLKMIETELKRRLFGIQKSQ